MRMIEEVVLYFIGFLFIPLVVGIYLRKRKKTKKRVLFGCGFLCWIVIMLLTYMFCGKDFVYEDSSIVYVFVAIFSTPITYSLCLIAIWLPNIHSTK